MVVLGHVDHGKSTLLDFIRKSNVVSGEAGGITQHVAAYEVEHTAKGADKPKRITFIDTPGHAAFKAIRSRGANIADIAILVVAADDGVKAQTLEALQSIKDAGIPFIVAINKIDKPNANVEKTQNSIMEHGVYLEKLGGDVPWTSISAKNGTGVSELLDLILLVAELENFEGDSALPAEGFCIEAHLDQKRGIAATLIITNGSLQIGQAVGVGDAIAPVRILENFAGKQIRYATFSSPVSLTGFDKLPAAGESFRAYSGKRDAEEARSSAMQSGEQKVSRAVETPSGEGQFSLPIIVRADTTGSLDAIEHEAKRLASEDSRITIVLSGIGNISENDIKTAASAQRGTPPAVIGFNVDIDTVAQERARQHGITIEKFDIIYNLVERLEKLLKESAPKKFVEETVGKARVAKCFSKRKDEQVIGGAVEEGYIAKGAPVRILRRKALIGIGKFKNLQAHKNNTDRVEAGSEFGAQIEAVFEISQGDILECFVTKQK